MEPIHIHNLLRQLSSEVKCPHCKRKVRPHMIRVENSSQNYCLLKIECYSCHEVFHGHAHVGFKVSEKNPQGRDLKNNVSYPAINRYVPPSPPPFTQEDIDQVAEKLKEKASGVTSLFIQ